VIVFFEKTSPHRDNFLLSVESVMLCVPLGILLANQLLKFDRREIMIYFSKEIEQTAVSSSSMNKVMILFLIFTIFVFMYIRDAKTIPLFYMFQYRGDFLALALLREDSMKLLDSPFRFIYHLLRDFAYPLLIVMTMGFYLFYRKAGWLILFFAIFASGLLYASFTLARLPPAAIIFTIFLYLYLYHKRIWKKLLVSAPILIFGFPLSVIVVGQANADLIGASVKILERVFLAPAGTLYYYFEVVPEQVGFLYGRTMGKITFFMGKEYFDIGNFVSQHITSSEIQSGSANATFIGSLYADFGIPGVISGGIFVGIVMQLICICMIRMKKSVFTMSAFTILIYEFGLLNILPLSSIIITSGVPILVIILLWDKIRMSIHNLARDGYYSSGQ
jgi:oligosaccharide repeat unit polymerase